MRVRQNAKRAVLLESRNDGSYRDRRPVAWGFRISLGVLGAALLALTVYNLRNVVLAVFIATFVALGVDPLLRWLGRRGLKRTPAILVVLGLFIATFVGIAWVVIPVVVEQASNFITSLPAEVARLQREGWFDQINAWTNGGVTSLVSWAEGLVADPNVWATIGNGALATGAAVLDGVSTGVFIFVLSLFFIATIDRIKAYMYTLVAKSRRESFVSYAERIMASVGQYLSGMVILAFCNAVFSTILLTIVGVRYALLIGMISLFVTLVPLIGSVIMTSIMTAITLLVSPTSALIVLIVMLVYMQVEAYFLTPKVMGKAVNIPGSVVLISAFAGGALMGLLGALVAIPISAGANLILREVIIPRRELR